jgi:hypothetical protein
MTSSAEVIYTLSSIGQRKPKRFSRSVARSDGLIRCDPVLDACNTQAKMFDGSLEVDDASESAPLDRISISTYHYRFKA